MPSQRSSHQYAPDGSSPSLCPACGSPPRSVTRGHRHWARPLLAVAVAALFVAALSGRSAPAQGEPRVRVVNEPPPQRPASVRIAAVLNALPAEDAALVEAVEFVAADGAGMVNAHACGEARVVQRKVMISANPLCLATLPTVLAHEIGHMVDYASGWRLSWRPGCAEHPSYPRFCPVEAERFADEYARGHGF